MGSSSLSEPTVSVLLNQNKYSKIIDVPTDEFSVSALANENLKEQTVNVLSDVGVTSTANEKFHENNAIPIDIVDLSDSLNQNVFNITLNDFTNIFLGAKNEFYKNHGKDENQILRMQFRLTLKPNLHFHELHLLTPD